MANSNQGLLSNLNPDAEAYNQEAFSLSESDANSAIWENANLDTALSSGRRILDQTLLERDTQNEPKLSPEELNKKFPKMPKPFTESTNLSVAQHIYGVQTARQDIQDRVNAGPQGTWYEVKKFGANMLAHAMDPLEFAAGYVVSTALPVIAGVTGIGKYLGIPTKEAIEAARVAGTALPKATVGQTVARLSVEGTLQNMANVPLDIYSSKQEQRDFNAEEALVGAVGAAIGFSVLHGAVKIGSNKLNRFLGRVTPKHSEAIQSAALSQVIEGKKVDVAPVLDEMISDTNIPNPAYEKVSSDGLHLTNVYSPKEQVTKNIESKSALISDDYGDGIYLTADKEKANGAAARKLNENDGSIIQGKIKDANLLDLDLRVDPKFQEIAKDSGIKIDENMSGKELFNQIHDSIESGKLPPNYLENLKEKAASNGIDGYRFTVNELAGRPHEPHDGFLLFNKDKFAHEQNLLPDTEAVKTITKEEAQAQFEKNQSIESSIHYNEDAAKSFHEALVNPPKEPAQATLKPQIEDFHQQIDDRIKLVGEESPAAKELVAFKEQAKLESQANELENTVLKAAFDCLGGH